MYFDDESERDPFEVFGEADAADDPVAAANATPAEANAPAIIESQARRESGGFSWAGFAGGTAALMWIAAAVGGPLSYFGVDAVLTMDPAAQAGMIAAAIVPALLLWLAASAAGEALKARRLASVLLAHGGALPEAVGEARVQRLSNTVKSEIEALNEAVAAALDRLSELEHAAKRNSALFDNAVAASRDNTEAMALAMRQEHDALMTLNGDLKGQTDTMAQSIGRQIRMMREASKLVKTEITAAEDALESHLAGFTASAAVLGERTAAIHHAANDATAATAALNTTMTGMLEGLAEATRLTDTARQSSEQAVLAANETAAAVRETTRGAVFEAKRAAQLIRAEAAAMQEAANDTLTRLQDAARAARDASEESQAAADRHAASLEKRLMALAGAATQRPAPAAARPAARTEAPRPSTEAPRPSAEAPRPSAAAATARARVRAAEPREAAPQEPKRVFKGFGGFSNLMPLRASEPRRAEREESELVEFGPRHSDAALKHEAMDLVADAGVDLAEVLQPSDLERIARSSRLGAAARRLAVAEAAPIAVNRIARHVKRHESARGVATEFRARPDLAKSENKGEGSHLVRAYLLIDAALA